MLYDVPHTGVTLSGDTSVYQSFPEVPLTADCDKEMFLPIVKIDFTVLSGIGVSRYCVDCIVFHAVHRDTIRFG